jgi:hypothetical protein
MEKLYWKSQSGELISCSEKLKVLNQNLEEILSIYKDALEDAILFGVSPDSFKQIIINEMLKV